MTTGIDTDRTNKLSVGEGIALAGIWLATSAVTVFVALILFVWSDTLKGVHTDIFGAFVLFLMIGAPVIAASSITKKIIGYRD